MKVNEKIKITLEISYTTEDFYNPVTIARILTDQVKSGAEKASCRSIDNIKVERSNVEFINLGDLDG